MASIMEQLPLGAVRVDVLRSDASSENVELVRKWPARYAEKERLTVH